MIKLAVDAMGGDFAPEMIVKGILKALEEDSNLYINLYGDKEKIDQIIEKNFNDFIKKRINIINTSFYLQSDIKNIREELRDNPKNSMFLALQDAKNDEVDGVVSAGPTQALVLASFLMIKTIPFAKRIALAPIFNSLTNKKVILIDAGANAETEPENLLNFAIYASVAAKELFQISNPVVKLLNIGIEKGKGRELERKIYDLLKKDNRIIFKGNEETTNILNTEADVLLSDGFTCNIVLKSYEGSLKNYFKIIKDIMTENWFKKIISKLLFAKKLKKIKKKLDSKEIGGAMLLGLNKIVIKAHGNSDEYAFYKAIVQAKTLIEKKFINKIKNKFKLLK
ncbi:glycerol-3-phosphate acyltransferase [Candidatus Phytoplasma luffae]|uniref:Phosphate acyltransferase n=1 Tax=Loofah witches'-broom phytoplasma TaxID=35773 RepID=A0A975FJF9_LOWBP|nr:phosphate acyltransferase PlsX [Candidatus Phytoplasma luffae]QTX02822.1 glycerol-3-phosphate acyltransferase [Candidatus Phytoplasma luffae]